MSLDRGLAPARHIAAGRALVPLREEHLLPLMVAAGAGGRGTRLYAEEVLRTRISGFAFA